MKKILVLVLGLAVVFLAVAYYNGNFKKDNLKEDESYNLISSLTYLCDESKNITADFYTLSNLSIKNNKGDNRQNNAKVELKLSDGRKFSLDQTISASGARYASLNKDYSEESIVFWNKGKTAFITEQGENSYANCIELASRQDNLSEVYKNNEMGFSVRYPKDYKLNEDYKYLVSEEDKEIKGFSFQVPESLTENTNLSLNSYISIETINSNNKECVLSNFVGEARDLEISEIKINGRDYYFSSFIESAVGNRYSQKIYTLKDNSSSNCLAVRYFIHYMDIANYTEGDVIEFDDEELLKTFDFIRDSLVLVK